MARLLDLKGEPLEWATLHARRRHWQLRFAPRSGRCKTSHHRACNGRGENERPGDESYLRIPFVCQCPCHIPEPTRAAVPDYRSAS